MTVRDDALQRVLDRLRETDSHGYTPITGDERDEMIEALESIAVAPPSSDARTIEALARAYVIEREALIAVQNDTAKPPAFEQVILDAHAAISETAQPPASEPFHFGKAVRDRALGQQPNNDEVICPNCCHQFRAIPVNVQAELAALRADGGSAKMPGAIKLAVFMHETYERLAPEYGYETRKETRTFNASTPNGKLMIAVCGELRRYLSSVNEESK